MRVSVAVCVRGHAFPDASLQLERKIARGKTAAGHVSRVATRVRFGRGVTTMRSKVGPQVVGNTGAGCVWFRLRGNRVALRRNRVALLVMTGNARNIRQDSSTDRNSSDVLVDNKSRFA